MTAPTALDLANIDWDTARQPCPACGRAGRDKALSVTLNADRTGVAHCYRCGFVELLRDDRRQVARAPRPHEALQRAERHETLSSYGRDLWACCKPVSGPALAYLEARGCVVPPADGDLRWHAALRHPMTGHTGPALVALLTDAEDARIRRTLHRSWVRADGSKPAEADPPRMLLGGHRKAGAACRLWPDEAVTLALGIAEGIETALSLAHGFAPVWAAIDAGNLSGFPVLAGLESLTVAADNDLAGLHAAEVCADRWRDAGREVRVIVPATAGADLNDTAAARSES